METYRIEDENFVAFEKQLFLDERVEATIYKYKKNLQTFFQELPKESLSKEMVLERKMELMQKWAISTVNGIISAVNRFFRFMGWHELCMKYFKRQRQIFAEPQKELTKAEYERLVQTAKKKGNRRLHLVIQTICATGIRVSELRYITAEAVRTGTAEVKCKGKQRTIFLPKRLQKMLQQYLREEKRISGPVFVTRTGKPLNRSNIWAEMKKLCVEAEVAGEKVFPHNLRHLFARTFYNLERDIAKLADLLGHSSIETTRIYIMESGEEHCRKLERMHLLI